MPSSLELAQQDFERATYRKITWRVMPLLFLCYVFAYLDRVNVGFAKLQMQQDLKISDSVYGAGAGIFFIGYFLFEIPCNLALQKVGARLWLGPIIIIWGLVSACTMLVTTAHGFYTVRFLLGVVESGFFPGVILYLTFWYPDKYRAKIISLFMTAIPLSGVIGGPISGWLLDRLSAVSGLRGWQWLFIVEAVPSILAGIATVFLLSNGPANAAWLSIEERSFVVGRLQEEQARMRARGASEHRLSDAFASRNVWLLAFIYFGFVMGNYGLGFWLPQILKETLTADPWKIGLLSAIPWGAAGVAMVWVGHHSDLAGERCWHIALSGIVGGFAFALSALPGIPGLLGLLMLTLATAGIAAAYSTFWSLPTAVVTGAAASAGIALVNSIGNLAGYVSPLLVGKIRDVTHSSTPALLLLSACCLSSTILVIAFFRKRTFPSAA